MFVKTLLFLFTLILCSCNSKIAEMSSLDGMINKPPNNSLVSVTINQAVQEFVGSCNFNTSFELTNLTGFSYRIHFSEIIDLSSFTLNDIVNTGTGGGHILDWELEHCGDGRNFKLTAKDIEGNGTIVPVIIAGGISDIFSNTNTD